MIRGFMVGYIVGIIPQLFQQWQFLPEPVHRSIGSHLRANSLGEAGGAPGSLDRFSTTHNNAGRHHALWLRGLPGCVDWLACV